MSHQFTNVKIHDCAGETGEVSCNADALSSEGKYLGIVATKDRISIYLRKFR